MVTVDGARLHRRGARSEDGWLSITAAPQEVDLTHYKDGSTFHLLRKQVFEGRYDATELLGSDARGTLQDGNEVDVPLQLTPVRTDVRVRTGLVTQLTYDLVVHDLSDHGKTWGLLLREVRVEYLGDGL